MIRRSNQAATAPLAPVAPAPSVPLAPAPLLLLLAAVLFALMAVWAKKAAALLPGPEVAFVRFCIGLLACALAATRIEMRTRNRVGLLLRGAYGGAAVLLYFLAIAHLPVGVATLLNYTAPVFTAIYAATFMGESVRRGTWVALLLTTLGVGLVMKGSTPPGSWGLGPWQLVGIGSAVLSGAAVATIREVRKTDGSWETFTAFCVGGALITGAPAMTSWVPPSAAEWVSLLAVGVLSLFAQLLMTYSLRFVRAAVAGVIAQLTPVAALAMGWFFFQEDIASLTIAGAVLTLTGVTWGAYLASVPEAVEGDV